MTCLIFLMASNHRYMPQGLIVWAAFLSSCWRSNQRNVHLHLMILARASVLRRFKLAMTSAKTHSQVWEGVCAILMQWCQLKTTTSPICLMRRHAQSARFEEVQHEPY